MTARPRQPESQASPLAEDVLGLLRSQIRGGQIGLGFGPLQREAGTAARQFVSSGGGIDVGELIRQMEVQGERRIGEQALDLREAFGAAGARFGSPLAQGEARLRREGLQDIARQTAETRLGAEQFNVQSMLAGIELLNRIGAQNLAPFFALAEQGILPEVFEQHPLVTAGQAIGQLGRAGAAFRGGG